MRERLWYDIAFARVEMYRKCSPLHWLKKWGKNRKQVDGQQQLQSTLCVVAGS